MRRRRMEVTMLRTTTAALAAFLALAAPPARAAEPAHVKVEAIAPRPEDVATIDGIMKAFYEVISGPAGAPRQWARDRSLYIKDVRFASMRGKDGTPVASVMSHQEYVDRTDPMFAKAGFDEPEIH